MRVAVLNGRVGRVLTGKPCNLDLKPADLGIQGLDYVATPHESVQREQCDVQRECCYEGQPQRQADLHIKGSAKCDGDDAHCRHHQSFAQVAARFPVSGERDIVRRDVGHGCDKLRFVVTTAFPGNRIGAIPRDQFWTGNRVLTGV
jgi:hypothetical protein